MKINVREELKRLKTGMTDYSPVSGMDLSTEIAKIADSIRDLKKADLKIFGEVGRLADELKKLWQFEKNNADLLTAQVKKQEKVLLDIYDHIENQLKMVKRGEKSLSQELLDSLLDDVKTLFVIELEWVVIETLGQKYNPHDYDGFVTMNRARYQDKGPAKLEIVNELRSGFSCNGKTVRKPIVEFYE